MTALAGARCGSMREVASDYRPLAAGARVYKGGVIAAILSGTGAGYYKQAASTGVLGCLGIAQEDVDNTNGAAGAAMVNVDFGRVRRLQLMVNDTTGTPVTVASRESTCYALDDQTVTGAANTARAGVVYDVTNEGVWVELGSRDSSSFDSTSAAKLSHLGGSSNWTIWNKEADDATALTATAEHSIYVATGNETITDLRIIADSAVVAGDNNYATITVSKRDGIGGAASVIASLNTDVAGGAWSAFVAKSLGTVTGGALAAGNVLTVKIAKTGTGKIVPALRLVAIASIA